MCKCECLSVLDLKYAYHTITLLEDFKQIVAYYLILILLVMYIKECQWDKAQVLLYGNLT